MDKTLGLRERKKLETRHLLGDVAARLFAERGYDAVAVSDVARAANVSDQTVYNYFPTKPDLVFDRADEILERSRRLVAERPTAETPADTIRRLVHEDIERFRDTDLAMARGELPAQSLQSDVLRRRLLEFRHDQGEAIAGAIVETAPGIPFLVARAHANALVAIIHAISVRIGAAILADTDRDATADEMWVDADTALTDAADNFRATQSRLRTLLSQDPS
jgi:AcrR family transcriptional regulator